MATPIVLVRNAESQHRTLRLTGGWTETDLTENGRQQARCVAEYLKREIGGTPTHLYTSDLRHARQTAEIVGRSLHLQPIPLPDLREVSNGLAAGRTVEEAERFRLVPPTQSIDLRPYPESETWREFHNRVAGCMRRIAREPDGLPVVVVHRGTVIQAIAWWLKLDPNQLGEVSFGTAPTGITLLKVNNYQEHVVERLNDIGHLFAAGLMRGIPGILL